MLDVMLMLGLFVLMLLQLCINPPTCCLEGADGPVFVVAGKYGAHRVCVVEAGGTVVKNIVTQSAVLRMLEHYLADFSGLVNLTIHELEMDRTTDIISAAPTDTYHAIFSKMCANVR